MSKLGCLAAAALVLLGGAFAVDAKGEKPRKAKRPPAPKSVPRKASAKPAQTGDPLLQARAGDATPDQWALRAIGFEVRADPALQPVVVAVIDTGLDYLHPDLAPASVWRNPDEKMNGVDDDGDGYVDDMIGWNFVDGDNNPWDPVGHGTHVAGVIAAATNNGEGIAGLNPAARILPLRALNASGHGRSSQIAAAIYYAARHGARVINLSLGGEEIRDAERRAVAYAVRQGAVIVVPAGNTASSTESLGLAALPGVIAVAATDRQDHRASFSSYGPQVKLAAPGVDILSLRARGTDLLAVSGAQDYRAGSAVVAERYYAASGTPFATAFVSGLASLLIARNPALEAEQVERILLQSARDVEAPGIDQRTGYGLLDARAALAADPVFFVEARITSIEVAPTDAGVRLRVTGVADADAFAGAYLEVAPGDGETLEFRQAVPALADPVRGALLADLDASTLGPGRWTLRLVAVHENGRERESRAVIELE